MAGPRAAAPAAAAARQHRGRRLPSSGAGYTGLWTAYYLKRADPGLRVVVLEQHFAGFGASGRNGGWVTATLPGSRARYARGPQGRAGVRELERQLRDTVDEVARVWPGRGHRRRPGQGRHADAWPPRRPRTPGCASGWRPNVAWGDGPGIVRYLDKDELAAGVQVTGADRGPVLAALRPGAARQPGRGPGRGGEPAPGVDALRGHPGDVDLEPGLARTDARRRPRAVRAALHRGVHRGPARPAPDAAADEQLHDRHRAAERGGLEDDRLGRLRDARRRGARLYLRAAHRGRPDRAGRPRRPVPVRLRRSTTTARSRTRPSPSSAGSCAACSRRPPGRAWTTPGAGCSACRRDWCATVTLDPRTGLGWAGGYSGHGVAAANLAGRTLADLVRGVDSPLTALPWVGHRCPRWEPEPARWAGVHGLYALYRTADRLETARPFGPDLTAGPRGRRDLRHPALVCLTGGRCAGYPHFHHDYLVHG